MDDESSAFAWDGTPAGSAPHPPSPSRRRPLSRTTIGLAALVVALAVALVVGLGAFSSGSSAPSQSTFNTEIAAICGRVRVREASIPTPVAGNLRPFVNRQLALLTGAVADFGALTPPAGAAAPYRAYVRDLHSDLTLARALLVVTEHVNPSRVSSVLNEGSRLASLNRRESALEADTTREARLAGVRQCNYSTQQTPSKSTLVAAAAKELAHTAQVAAETYATDNNGSYSGLTPAKLSAYESLIATAPRAGQAWVSSVRASATGYSITVTPASGSERFSIARNNGGITRACTPAKAPAAGCVGGTW